MGTKAIATAGNRCGAIPSRTTNPLRPSTTGPRPTDALVQATTTSSAGSAPQSSTNRSKGVSHEAATGTS
jgi:hypothetical protein